MSAVKDGVSTISEVDGQATLEATLTNAKLNPVEVNLAFADSGNLVKTRCGGGMEHLHFHMSKRKGSNPNAWGTWRFLGEPSGWINPHKYWTGGVGKPECFVEGRKYPDGLLTLPVECKN